MSAKLIRAIQRAMLKLVTPATLSAQDRGALNNLLSPDEINEVFRTYADIKQIRELIHAAFYLNEYEDVEHELIWFYDAMYWDAITYRAHRRAAETKYPKGSYWSNIHTQIAEGYLARAVGYYDSMSKIAQRTILPFNRPITSYAPLYAKQPDRDLILWGDELTAWQQAYKEVFELKLKDLGAL